MQFYCVCVCVDRFEQSLFRRNRKQRHTRSLRTARNENEEKRAPIMKSIYSIWKEALLPEPKIHTENCDTLNWTELNRRRCNTQWKTLFFCWVHACIFVSFEVSLYRSFFSGFLVHLLNSQPTTAVPTNFFLYVCMHRIALHWLGFALC